MHSDLCGLTLDFFVRLLGHASTAMAHQMCAAGAHQGSSFTVTGIHRNCTLRPVPSEAFDPDFVTIVRELDRHPGGDGEPTEHDFQEIAEIARKYRRR